jgi:hypothetical protein
MSSHLPIRTLCSIGLVAMSLLGCAAVPRDRADAAEAAFPVTTTVSARSLPNDRGTLFADTANGEPAQLGIALNDPHSILWSRMSEASVKVSHGVVSVVRPNGESQWPWFPYNRFVSFEQDEVAAGRPPLRLTATYQGKSRPVYWNWSLGFPAAGQPPSVTDQAAWEQGVNIGDERYVAWLVDNYIKAIMFRQYFAPDGSIIDVPAPYPNEWLGVDQMAVNYHLFGVLDDAGTWVPMDAGPVMDAPFPNTSAALHDAYRQFFTYLHQVYPDIRVMANIGTPDDWTQFEQDFADVDGLVQEDLFSNNRTNPSDANRAELQAVWNAMSAYSASGRVSLWGSVLARGSATYETDLRSSLMAYLMLSGPSSAWAPKSPDAKEIPPADYQAMKTALGPTTGPMSIEQGGPSGAALYVRATQNGIVYVNETGDTVTVSCPNGVTCRDRSGAVVAQLSVPDLTGDYLLTSG